MCSSQWSVVLAQRLRGGRGGRATGDQPVESPSVRGPEPVPSIWLISISAALRPMWRCRNRVRGQRRRGPIREPHVIEPDHGRVDMQCLTSACRQSSASRPLLARTAAKRSPLLSSSCAAPPVRGSLARLEHTGAIDTRRAAAVWTSREHHKGS